MARSYVFQCLLLSFVAWAVLFAIWYSYTQNEPPKVISDDPVDPLTDGLKRFACGDTILSHLGQNAKWFVICIPAGNKVVVSKRFHTVVLHGMLVCGVPVKGAPSWSPYAKALIDDFRFPMENVGRTIRPMENERKIFQHFRNHMTQGPDFLIITTPCREPSNLTMAVSDGVKWTLITNQDECQNKHIVALPSASESCRFLSTDLRHLTVEGEYVVVRKNRVTNWTFVNNTLQNENGKCLTAWSERSTYLFEWECSEGWQGQTWIRHGLQIINGYRYCLSTRDNYVIQDFCESSARFLWRDRTCQRLIA